MVNFDVNPVVLFALIFCTVFLIITGVTTIWAESIETVVLDDICKELTGNNNSMYFSEWLIQSRFACKTGEIIQFYAVK